MATLRLPRRRGTLLALVWYQLDWKNGRLHFDTEMSVVADDVNRFIDEYGIDEPYIYCFVGPPPREMKAPPDKT